MKCVKCSASKAIRHHVTYEPELVARICPKCHTKITVVNTIAAVVLKKKLSNSIRVLLWAWFLIHKGPVDEKVVSNALGIEFKFAPSHKAFIKSTKTRMQKFERRGRVKKRGK